MSPAKGSYGGAAGRPAIRAKCFQPHGIRSCSSIRKLHSKTHENRPGFAHLIFPTVGKTTVIRHHCRYAWGSSSCLPAWWKKASVPIGKRACNQLLAWNIVLLNGLYKDDFPPERSKCDPNFGTVGSGKQHEKCVWLRSKRKKVHPRAPYPLAQEIFQSPLSLHAGTTGTWLDSQSLVKVLIACIRIKIVMYGRWVTCYVMKKVVPKKRAHTLCKCRPRGSLGVSSHTRRKAWKEKAREGAIKSPWSAVPGGE